MEKQQTNKQHEINLSGKVLSAKELFQYRKQTDKALPGLGGIKDFQPDGSWLQAKKLENFYQERKELLLEQRVERVGNLVTGDWNPENQLVELHKELGKFWVYMGFVDKSRKWLFPEEALYLMETNTMEVSYRGLPLSIQQAYGCFLSGDVTLEQYQVYTHLRRLGYVLIRHKGRFMKITEYEKKIKLDQHIKHETKPKKKRKADHQDGIKDVKKLKEISSVSKKDEDLSVSMDVQFSVDSDVEHDRLVSTTMIDNNSSIQKDYHGVENMEVERNISDDFKESEEKKETEIDCRKDEQIGDRFISYKMKQCERIKNKDSNIVINFSQPLTCSQEFIHEHQTSDFSHIQFPDIGQSKILQLSKSDKCSSLYPPGVNLQDIFTFDVEKYDQKFQPKNSASRREIGEEDLEYSFPPGHSRRKKNIKAKNWREYKAKLKELKNSSVEEDVRNTPVAHLWTGDVQPLMRPGDITSIDSVIDKLQIIRSVNQTHSDSDLKYKVVYDVYLPDAKFKKSNPGRPDHRLCIIRHDQPIPDLYSLTRLQQHYNDDIPLHWAVVDHGDIAFYCFTCIDIPSIL